MSVSPQSKNTTPSSTQPVEKVLREFLDVQKGEIEIKKQELKLEQEKIKSHQIIALASIEAQKNDRKDQMTLYSEVNKTKYYAIVGIAVLIAIILGIAMWLNKIEIAMEILKIGGTGLLAYLAGVNRGKNVAIEKQQRQDEE